MSEPRPTDRRVAALAELVADAGLDAIVVTKDGSIRYLTGFAGLQLERLFAVVVRRDGSGAVVVPELDRDGIAAAPTDLELALYGPDSDGLAELAAALRGARRVGVEEDHLAHGRAVALTAAGLELVPAAATVMDLRVAKDTDEVEAIRRAAGVVGEVLEEVFARLRPGDVEHEVNARAAYELQRRGAGESHALVLFGAHASQPHGEPDGRRLEAGDVVCADLSASVAGYWGDLTRCGTVGPPGDWASMAWEVVHRAYTAAVDAARPGAPARAVDAAQRRIVSGAADVGDCVHGAGHAIGLEVHEPPFLVPASDDVLRVGAVLTIEPGIYRTGQGGIRLEDDVLVSADGPVLLSHLPLELRHIPVDDRTTRRTG